jgi:hypothetical protein
MWRDGVCSGVGRRGAVSGVWCVWTEGISCPAGGVWCCRSVLTGSRWVVEVSLTLGKKERVHERVLGGQGNCLHLHVVGW